jgi:hypothetical protein
MPYELNLRRGRSISIRLKIKIQTNTSSSQFRVSVFFFRGAGHWPVVLSAAFLCLASQTLISRPLLFFLPSHLHPSLSFLSPRVLLQDYASWRLLRRTNCLFLSLPIPTTPTYPPPLLHSLPHSTRCGSGKGRLKNVLYLRAQHYQDSQAHHPRPARDTRERLCERQEAQCTEAQRPREETQDVSQRSSGMHPPPPRTRPRSHSHTLIFLFSPFTLPRLFHLLTSSSSPRYQII